tara:strand:- start:3988 stop:4635 length:648 start_codon:yes stop_codon:yes gene_type:complete
MKFRKNIKLNTNDLKKSLKLPLQMSKELAEFIGIHFGDGYMKRRERGTYDLHYSINLRDIEYANHINTLFYSLFNIKLKMFIIPQKNAIDMYQNSKSLCTFFNQELKIPYSPKKELPIPKFIKSNKTYAQHFIRGIFDTDGCIVVQRDKGKYLYNLIKISTSIKSFADDIKLLLNELGLRCYICRDRTGFDIVIRNKDSFSRFIRLVQPKNNKGK